MENVIKDIWNEVQINDGFRTYMDKEFEVCPGWSISRGEYEGFSCAMQCWNWSDEKMTELAKKIAEDFEPVIEDDMGKEIVVPYNYRAPIELEDAFECLCDSFYTTMENCAYNMGMRYYEDFTEEEDAKDLQEYNEFINSFN